MKLNKKRVVAAVAVIAIICLLLAIVATVVLRWCNKEQPPKAKKEVIINPAELVRQKMFDCSQRVSDANLMDIEIAAQFISNECGIEISPKNLVYLARLVYFETGFGSAEQMIRSSEAISAVILNRHLYDLGHGTDYFDGNKGIFAVAIQNSGRKNKDGALRGWQFSSFAFFWDYFYDVQDANGKFAVRTRQMAANKSNIAYMSLVNVLTSQVDDPVCGALYYKNTELTDKMNGRKVVWNHQPAGLGAGVYLQWTGELNGCPTMVEGHHYYAVYAKN